MEGDRGGSDEEQQEEEEKQETSEEEDEAEEEEEEEVSGASKRSAASEDELEENCIASRNKSYSACSPVEIRGSKRRIVEPEAEDNKVEHTLSWVPTVLATIKAIDVRMTRHDVLIAHPSGPKSCVSDLERVRNAAMVLVNDTDAAISKLKAQQSLLDRKALKEKLLAIRRRVARLQAEHRKKAALLLQAKAELSKSNNLFQKEKEALTCLIAQYAHEQRDLKRQLEEEREKSICCVCHDKPRDTIILPCLHFQYCFSCLLLHREANSNTCPTCRGPIQWLSMSSYLATQ